MVTELAPQTDAPPADERTRRRRRTYPRPVEAALPPERREALRAELLAATPRWYVPTVHMLVPSLCGIAMIAIALSLIRDLTAWQLLTVPIVYVLANANEWTIHRI